MTLGGLEMLGGAAMLGGLSMIGSVLGGVDDCGGVAVAMPGRLTGVPTMPRGEGIGADEICGASPGGADIMPGGSPVPPPPVGPNGTIEFGVCGVVSGPKFMSGFGPGPPGAGALSGGEFGAS